MTFQNGTNQKQKVFNIEDIDFLLEAYKEAMEFSTDKSTQNGAVLVKNGTIIARGANHFPKMIKETEERWQRPLKYSFVEHAERNVIYSAAKNGTSTNGTTMYCPWFACADCGRAIIQAGIIEVVGHNSNLHRTRPDWHKTIEVALDMFEEAGIKTRWITDQINGVEILFDGKLNRP